MRFFIGHILLQFVKLVLEIADAFVPVGICVRKSRGLTCLWLNLVPASLIHGMALDALLNKNLLVLFNVTHV